MLAYLLPRETVFLIGLVVPAISVTGVLLIRSETSERRPIDWRILGGGLAFGAVVALLGLGGVPFAQEIIFVISMGVVCGMLVFVTRELDHKTRMIILYAAIIIFAFRSTPSVGDGYFWFTLDVLKFDEAFYGILRPDRRDHRDHCDVAAGQADHRVLGRQDPVLDRGRGHHPVAAEHRALLRPA